MLYSDLYDHKRFVRALCNASFSGLLWTPEVRSARDAEEWLRRMQTVCFSPLAMLNAWSSGTKPWSFPEAEAIVRRYVELRMRLLPYFYSAFARYHFDGTPPFRAMALEPAVSEGDAGLRDALMETDDQYMAGESLLVAPLFAGQESRNVLLPAGIWYDFDTGERLEGGRQIEVRPGRERIPVFARDGAIIPLMPASASAPQAGESAPLEVVCFGTADREFMLFDDDGETFRYERGEYHWRRLSVETGPDGTRQGEISSVERGWRSSYGEITWRFIL